MLQTLAQVIHPWIFHAPLLILNAWTWGPGL